jgi:hypothetical protein
MQQLVVNVPTYLTPIVLRDADNEAVTDKVNADFDSVATLLDENAADEPTTITMTVTHIGNGRYMPSGTLTETGLWEVFSTTDVDGELFEDMQAVQVVTAAQFDPAGALSGVSVTVTSPLNTQTKNLTVVQGTDYLASEDTAPSWVGTGWPNLTGADVDFTIRNGVTDVLTVAATVVTAGTGSQTVRAELTSVQTAALSRGIVYRYVLVTDGDDLLAKGRVIVVSGL